jgi:hypothetical protein
MVTVKWDDMMAEFAERDRLDDLFRQRSPILWWLSRVPLGLVYSLGRFLESVPRFLFSALPFRVKHGFWYSEVWSLDRTIAEFTLPRLRYLESIAHGYPTEAGNEHVWSAMIGEMVWFLEIHARDDGLWRLGPEDKARYENAGMLFGKYFGALWD